MMLPWATEVYLIGAVDRGIANQERIVMRPAESVNLVQFVVCLAHRMDNGFVQPIIDRIYWFPETKVEPPSWVVLYTGPGEARVTTLPPSNQRAYTFHWGLELTVLDNPKIVPVVFRIDAIALEALTPVPAVPVARELPLPTTRS